MNQIRKQYLVIVLCAVLAFGTPMIGFAAQQYAQANLHSAFSANATSNASCGIICKFIGGVVDWLVAKALDYYYDNMPVPTSDGCFGPVGSGGGCGGGGGRAF